ncbi:MAG: glycerol-3-phosphate dehydrogenase subunit GlpB [Rudaea sp.]
MLDLVVVGAGLAGYMAAYEAARAGLRVKVIARGLGALHWSAGTVDLLGYYPDDRSAVDRPIDSIGELVEQNPLHPYAVATLDRLGESLKQFLTLAFEQGLPYVGARRAGSNIWLPSPAGAARPTFLAPEAQAAGDLGSAVPMLIVGFSGLRDFFPELIAENLRKHGHAARAELLPYELLSEMRDRTNVQLAGELDRPERRENLAASVRKILRPGERVGMPALLGLGEHREVIQDLARFIGAPIFEIPTLPPSVPGVRLNMAMQKGLEKLGVRVDLNMNVTGFEAEGDRLLYLESETSARPLKHYADSFLLATGGILGGGIETDHRRNARECVLNLPLVLPDGNWLAPHFFEPNGHPIFRSGVRVNERFQPLDLAGAPVYRNVFAAGALLSDADPIRERSLEGIALATGFAAGRFAAERQRLAPSRLAVSE